MIVYKATNVNTNKSYIGKTVRTLSHAKARHKGRAFRDWVEGCESLFYNSIRRHGWEAFTWEVLYEGTSDKDIQEKEREFIENLQTLYSGYNLTPGGDGGAGKKLSDRQKEKLRDANLGEKNSCYGKFGEAHPAYGHKKSKESREAISKAHLGRPKSEDHKRKLSEAKKRISRFTQEDYSKMVQMRTDDKTYGEIGKHFNTSGSVVYKIIKREAMSNMRQSTSVPETFA